MIREMLCVYDRVTAIHSLPFFAPRLEAAVRDFRNALTDPNSSLSLNASDYVLHHLGTYSDETAGFEIFPIPKLVLTGATIAAEGETK